MAGRLRDYESGWAGGFSEAQAHRLDPMIAQVHAWATGVLAYWGFTEPMRPDIISGYRSPQKQLQLIRAWNSGQRAGFSGRPATRSWHTVGRAIDVQDDVQGFEAYAWLLTSFTGARDGRTFGDPGHFDWPTADQPPSVYEQV